MKPCKECYCWIQKEGLPENVGMCKANPPQLLMQKFAVDSRGQAITSPLQKQAGLSETPNAFFPMTTQEDGCGAWRPKETH